MSGTDHQNTITRFLNRQGIIVIGEEDEGQYIHEGRWSLTGHRDGLLEVFDDLLECKAIKARTFGNLKKTMNWKGNVSFGAYTSQGVSYCHLFEKAIARFVFYNRNTSDMLGSVPGIEHPQYEYREDLLVEYKEEDWNRIVEKHDLAYGYIMNNEIPACDLSQCWYCGTAFKGGGRANARSTTKSKINELEGLLP
jgi:hypothetical protein